MGKKIPFWEKNPIFLGKGQNFLRIFSSAYLSWKWEFLNFEKTSEIRENRRIQFYSFPQDFKISDATKKSCMYFYTSMLACWVYCITPGTNVVRNYIFENSEKYPKWLKLRGRGGQNHLGSNFFHEKSKTGRYRYNMIMLLYQLKIDVSACLMAW